MKKVALLGDSIRLIGYGMYVPELLGKEYKVFQPEDNCRFAKYTLRGLFDWKDELADCDIIHWNNGHWDICNLFGDGCFTSKEEYLDTVLRIARLLKEITPRVIFATSTPVRHTHPYNRNEDIKKYNDLVVPKLRNAGVVINDLFDFVLPHLEEYVLGANDNAHLTEIGARACAEKVAKEIRDIF